MEPSDFPVYNNMLNVGMGCEKSCQAALSWDGSDCNLTSSQLRTCNEVEDAKGVKQHNETLHDGQEQKEERKKKGQEWMEWLPTGPLQLKYTCVVSD